MLLTRHNDQSLKTFKVSSFILYSGSIYPVVVLYILHIYKFIIRKPKMKNFSASSQAAAILI